MRLTDEEKRIAEGVAAGWVRGGASWDAAWGLAMKYIATRREAFGEKTSTPATAAGVAAPPPEAIDEPGAAAQAPPTFEDELADLINRHGIDSQHNTPDSVLSRFVMRVLEAHLRAAEHRSAELPSVVVAAPRGVVVTAAQRKAVAVAASVYRVSGWKDRVTGWQEVADELDGLLAAIDAAKGGGA